VKERASLSSGMAYRLEKAFDVKMGFLLRMQVFYDTARIKKEKPKINVPRFEPAGMR